MSTTLNGTLEKDGFDAPELSNRQKNQDKSWYGRACQVWFFWYW